MSTGLPSGAYLLAAATCSNLGSPSGPSGYLHSSVHATGAYGRESVGGLMVGWPLLEEAENEGLSQVPGEGASGAVRPTTGVDGGGRALIGQIA
jgi:hypothetical protein